MITATELQSRIKATCLLAAIGDALGMPVEIMTAEKIAEQYGRIIDYIDPPKDHKWHGEKMKAGMWTDDWQLTMAMAQSLIRSGGIDMDDIARSHVTALEESVCGWGGSTTAAVKKIQSGVHWSESGIFNATGNGISMKIAPVGLLLATKYPREKAVNEICKFISYRSKMHVHIEEIAKMTHQSRMAIASGLAQTYAVFASITLPEEKFAENFLLMVADTCRIGEESSCGDTIIDKLSDRIMQLFQTRDYEHMSLKELTRKYGGEGKARFYVLNSLSLSYALFLRNPCSIETLFDVVNAGGDTDTNASMVGALLGARNGMSILSQHQHLIDGLWRKEEVITTAEQFCDTFIK